MSKEIVKQESELESVLIGGDLSKLSPLQRVEYYRRVCESLGLNPLTRPFEYIQLNGRLTLYARKDATDQLRKINLVSIHAPQIEYVDDWIIVTITASTPDGRTDTEIGVVSKRDMGGNFGNSLMKAITKAKRRVTLSICGLGWLDETETETIPGAVVYEEPPQASLPKPSAEPKRETPSRPYPPEALKQRLLQVAETLNATEEQAKKYRQEVAPCLEYVFMSADKREMFQVWLYGKPSLKDAPDGLVAALHRWLKPKYDKNNGVYIPEDEFASAEANAALEDYLTSNAEQE